MSDTELTPWTPTIGEDELRFYELIQDGQGQLQAAIQVGWSPRQLRSRLTNKDFAEMVQWAEQLLTETFEEVLYEKARAGHMRALELVLTNRAPHRWRDHVGAAGTQRVDINIVTSAKEAVIAVLRETGAASLQPPVTSIEATATDAAD